LSYKGLKLTVKGHGQDQSQDHHLTPRLKPHNFAIGHFLQNAF